MTLLLDAGPAGLKWARLEGAAPGPVSTVAARADGWPAALAALTPAPRRVLVANVAGAAFAARFGAFARETWRVEADFVVPERVAFGVTNGYERPELLGADRWLAMLATGRRDGGPRLVVGAGSVLTVDLVDGAGRHCGDCVMPGERLMREALHAQTSGIAAAALLDDAAVDGAFGVNTAGAVQQGARLALAALVDRLAATLEAAVGAPVRIVIGGVAARDLLPLLRRPAEFAPDLVLEGLALVASERTP